MLREKKLLYYPYQLYKIFIYCPLLALSTAFFGSMTVILLFFVPPRIATSMGTAWSRFNSYITPMFLKVKGRENIIPGQSYIVVANHQSQYDIFVIYGWLPLDFRWVMKIQLRKIPFLGFACYRLGHIFIDRSNTQSALDSINAAKDRIKNGTSVLFFPEGTRSNDGKLKQFKKGAFKLAIDMRLPVLPVSISGTKNILPNKSAALFPGRAKLVINKPVSVEGYSNENIDDLISRVRDSLQKGLE